MIVKRILCLVIALCAMASVSVRAFAEAGCPAPNWYEIFVRSYRDSDGDGIGDLRGVIESLDYIEDMGWRGLWLMPVMPSPSYHKYDVTDYCAVDPEYGTPDDMRALIGACHERGIAVIVDLPVNHTSTAHPWFVAACEALRRGDADEPYVGYYNFARDARPGYAPLEGTEWYYEEQFSGGGMPDLNLDNPAVWDEIQRIFEFWLDGIGADGFRLDAVTSYHTGDVEANVACLDRLKSMAEAARPGSFLVGECWANLSTIARYSESDVDSFFLFPAAQAEGFIARSMNARRAPAETFAKEYGKVLDAMPDAWLTPFLCNHDTGRTVGLVRGRENPDAAKFAEGLLGMLNGSVFTYYGEEIGMVGSGDDPNKRLAMYWSDDEMTEQPPGTTSVEYAYPPVAVQADDPDSLLNYVKAVNRARLENPAISSGKNEFLLAEGSLCLMRRGEGDGARLIAINFSATDAATVEVDAACIAADIETGEARAALDGRALTLPPRGIAILAY